MPDLLSPNCCDEVCLIFADDFDVLDLDDWEVLSGSWAADDSLGFDAVKSTGAGKLRLAAEQFSDDWHLSLRIVHEDYGVPIEVIIGDDAGDPGVTVRVTFSQDDDTCGELDILDDMGVSLLPYKPKIEGQKVDVPINLLISKTGDRLIAEVDIAEETGVLFSDRQSASASVDMTGISIGDNITLHDASGNAWFAAFQWDRKFCHGDPCGKEYLWTVGQWAIGDNFDPTYSARCNETVTLGDFYTAASTAKRPASVIPLTAVVTPWDREHGYTVHATVGWKWNIEPFTNGERLVSIWLEDSDYEARFSVVSGPQPYGTGIDATYIRMELWEGGSLLASRDVFATVEGLASMTRTTATNFMDACMASMKGDQFVCGVGWSDSDRPMYSTLQATTVSSTGTGGYVKIDAAAATVKYATGGFPAWLYAWEMWPTGVHVIRCPDLQGCLACEETADPPIGIQHSEYLQVALPTLGAGLCGAMTVSCRYVGCSTVAGVTRCDWEHTTTSGHVVVSLTRSLIGQCTWTIKWKSCDSDPAHLFTSDVLDEETTDCDALSALSCEWSEDASKLATITSL